MTRFCQKTYILLVAFFTYIGMPGLCFSHSPAQESFFNLSSLEPNICELQELGPEPLYVIHIKGDYLVDKPRENMVIEHKDKLTYVKPQTPAIFLGCHVKLPYYYIETDIVKGWAKKENVVVINESVFKQLVFAPRMILKQPIDINGGNYPVATALPVVKESRRHFEVAIVREDGSTTKQFLRKEMLTTPLNPKLNNFTKVAHLFQNKPYAWANSDAGWDCSGLLQDYFSFFNIRMPRNSMDQINFFEKLDVSQLEVKEKERVLKKANPYLTLLYFPGHIMLYTGKKGKEFMSFQALNRIGKRTYGRISYYPLRKTGLLKKVTHIGFIDPAVGGFLTNYWIGNKLQDKTIQREDDHAQNLFTER